jgi:hypothetical protein
MRLFILAFVFALPCFPQGGKAELFGTITDPSGLPVANAKVQAVDQATMAGVSAVSDSRGEYHLLGLAAGQYVLTVEQPGFRTYRQSGLTLRVDDRTALDVRLQVGQPTESVEVTATAPLLQTAGGDVSYHLDSTNVTTLPLDGRNFIPLVALAPGVALPGGGSLLPRINGSRPRTSEYLYDGISALQPEPGQVVFYPIIDAIEEFRLNINSYSPEYGRSNGGTIMLASKSGGNSLHGTLFEFFRNEDLNARNYFAQPGRIPEFRRNQYGLALGGPVRKNKTFFFIDWQGTRLRTGITRFSTVPTVAQRQTVLAAIPASNLDPIGMRVLNHYPTPNLPGAANNYVRTGVEPDSQDQLDARIDHYFATNHRVFGRYSYFRDDDNPVTPLPDGSGSIPAGVISHTLTRGDQAIGEYDWTVSPSILNQARFGYTRRSSNGIGPQGGDIAVPGVPANSFATILPLIAVTGFQQIGAPAGANSKFTTSVTEFLDTFSMVRGRHTFKFGTDLRREALDVVQPPNPAGSYTFIAGPNPSSLASLLLGQVNAFSIDIQTHALQERAHIAEFFVSDDWRISDRLSLNFGTRYTLNFPSTEVHNQDAIFNLNSQVLDFPHTARELECCDFGPRVGLAYRIGDTWVVRSGYGMIWFEQSGITTPFTLPQFPFVQTVGQQSLDNVSPAFLLANGPSIQVAPPNPNSGLGQGVFGVDRNVGSGFSQQWNLTVQKTIGQNLNVEAGYLGSKNTHLGLPESNLNQLPAADLAMGAALLTKVPNPYFGQIPTSSSLGTATIARQQLLRAFPRFTTVALFRDNVGDSEYDALQVKLEKRFSRGLTFTAAYTFSKLIDDASSYFSQTIFTGPVLNTTGAADAFNRRLERDVSSGDIPRVFSAGWVYQIPKLWKISGWEIAGLVRVQSGDAVPVSQATNSNSSLGYALQRPNRVADPNSFDGRSAARWFNTAAFTVAPQFTIGTSSRNPIRGPGLQEADLMLGKTFRITERIAFEFRAEVFNVTNTPPFNDPSGSFGTAAFGSITTAGNPRDFEFAAKVRF